MLAWCSSHVEAVDNVFRVHDEQLDRLYSAVDSTLAQADAEHASREGDRVLAEQAYVVPLERVPSLLVTSTKVLGNVVDNPFLGPFWQLHTWGLR